MKKLFLVILVFLAVAIVMIIMEVGAKGEPPPSKVVALKVGQADFNVEIADTPTSRARGLSGRAKLGENEGMFFIFDMLGQYSFWMKDMKFPIDIIWIADDKVVGIVLGAEPESMEPPTIYTPPQPVDKVLEINAGAAIKFGINVGDEISMR